MTQMPAPGMAPQPQPVYYPPPPAPPARKGGCGKWVIGCGLVLVVCAIICGGVGYYVYLNAGTWTRQAGANLGKPALVKVVDDAAIPPEQKAKIKARIDTLSDEFVAGKISLDQMGTIFSTMMKSSVMPALMAAGMEKSLLANSSISDENKAEARLQFRRLGQGVIQQKISQAKFEQLTAPFKRTDADGKVTFVQPTDDELIALIQEVKELADDAQIEAQPEEIDFAAAFDKAIEDAKKQQGH